MIKKYQIVSALENIYINPLEKCNLDCKYCYTKKTQHLLSNNEILKFIDRYSKFIKLKSIYFCGGEVFTLPDFPELINELSRKNIFTRIITNGTINRLKEIKNPENCQLLVSLDGPQEIHDENRGKGNFQKTIEFIKNALSLNFPVEIMFLITPKSYPYLNSFPKSVNLLIRNPVNFIYITQKTFYFTQGHPLNNQNNKQKALIPEQIINIKQNYPSSPERSFGCYLLSLQSNGLIYGCCEAKTPIAKISDPVEVIVNNFKNTLSTCQKCEQKNCLGCCEPNFLCGYIKELGEKKCSDVAKKFI